ncbi:MAG: leucine-rich repeat domain-containing protein, partial [Lachnospiraceae bacterium]|nr:leucine-rich repeat domain-containing protein [Lachnospiraceae bacterium]
MAKRTMAVILSLVLVMAGLPVFGNVEAKAASSSYEFCDDVFKYFIVDETEKYVAIMGFVDKRNYPTTNGLTLPSTVEYEDIEYTVTQILDNAFLNHSEIKGQLVLPEKLQIIEWGAFAYCTGLEGELILPASLASINSSAFEGDYKFTSLINKSTNLDYIGAYAFRYCFGLKGEFELPVCGIDERAFYGTRFDTLIIPEEYGTGWIGNTSLLTDKPWGKIVNKSDSLSLPIDYICDYYDYVDQSSGSTVNSIGKGTYIS